MPTAPVPVEAAPPASKPEVPGKEQSAAAEPESRWQKYVTPRPGCATRSRRLDYCYPELEFLGRRHTSNRLPTMLTFAATSHRLAPRLPASFARCTSLTISRCTKGTYWSNWKTTIIQAQVDQASAAVEAAKAAIENNRSPARVARRSDSEGAGRESIKPKPRLPAAQAGKEATNADLVRARSERKRQEGLYQTHSTTQQKVEQAVADEERLAAQYASRDADLEEARTMLRSSEAGGRSRAPREDCFGVSGSYNSSLTCGPKRQPWPWRK